MANKPPPFAWASRFTGPGGMLLVLFVVLALLLCGDFFPSQILYSNDGPLGRLVSECHRLPARFFGSWLDLNSIGLREGGLPPDISSGLQWLLKPVWFSKLYVPIALVLLGLGAWSCFRQWNLAPLACVLGGLAATLNSGFFSAACWGVAAHPITVGMSFFALAAVSDTTSRWRWLRLILAGLAVGLGVTEGADIGALFSVLVAACMIYQACVATGPFVKNVAVGSVRLALVIIFAIVVAAQALSGFISGGIEGVSGTQQDEQTKTSHWDWATQWSLPKTETLSLIIPGLFGYRLDTPNGGSYWGAIGRAPEWDSYYANGEQGPQPQGFQRYVGGGSYVGIPVALIALWSAAQSLRRKDSLFSLAQRRMLWFWSAVGLVSLLLAFGRFAPFYALVYKLPYISTVRNPVKFLHILSFSLIVLFAYGVDGLWRRYLCPANRGITLRQTGFRSWWTNRAGRFEKRWVLGCWLTFGLSLVGWLIYALSRHSLELHLQDVQINEHRSEMIAAFSIRQVGWFVLFFAFSAGLMVMILSGSFTGTQARWGGAWLGLLLVLDLGRANLPWILYWDYKDKYASNPIIDVLRENPYEHRVAILPLRQSSQATHLETLYKDEWMQQQFPYYNVQSLDVVQMSRPPRDLTAFGDALIPHAKTDNARLLIRRFQLTNTRYLLGQSAAYDFLNADVDPAAHRFQIVERFNLTPKPGLTRLTGLSQITARSDTNGLWALFEFTGALPRAKLYSHWLIITNDETVLTQLASESFDPAHTVLVAGGLPASASTGDDTNHNAGTVGFASYSPKDIFLKCNVLTPAILLFNDHYNPDWRVLVDGQPMTLLRCNYLMRGVYLTAGAHTVEFRLPPTIGFLYVSLSAMGVGLLLLGFVIVAEWRKRAEPRTQPLPPRPPSQSPPAQPKAKPNRSRNNPQRPEPKSNGSSSKGQATHRPADRQPS